MAKRWLVDGRTLAKKIKASGLSVHQQVKDSGAYCWECPQCSCRIDHICDESSEMPGLPSGVKFDPADVELLDHLAAKCGAGNEKPHEYLDVFIPTIDVDKGICYEHPENLPGDLLLLVEDVCKDHCTHPLVPISRESYNILSRSVSCTSECRDPSLVPTDVVPGSRKDGNSFHFFYQTTNAYAKGQRKRRKICNRSSLKNDVCWHKTGKTKAIFKNGVQIGCQKILVLYGAAVGGSKPCKMNWVMHQYHLGTNEYEKDGEYVVSKIFYQAQKQTENTNVGVVDEVSDPRTPMINASDPLRPGKTPLYEDVTCDYVIESPTQESECVEQKYLLSFSNAEVKDDLNLPACGDESKAIDLDVFHNSSSGQDNMDDHYTLSGSGFYTNDAAGAASDIKLGTTDLENLDLGSPPYVNLAELYFPCEDSFCGWLDWL